MGRYKKNKDIEEDDLEKSQKVKKPEFNLKGDVKRSIVAMALLVLAALLALGFFDLAGSFGKFLNKISAYSIGWAKFIFPAFLVAYGIALLFRREKIFYVVKLIGLGALFLSLAGLFHWFFEIEEKLSVAKTGQGGGYVGYAITYILEKYLGSAGGLVVLLALFFLGFILAFNFSLMDLFLKIKKKKEEKKEQSAENAIVAEEIKNKQTINPVLTETGETERKENSENIKKIEFVDGRDQFVSPEIENSQRMEEVFSGRKIMQRKSIDSGSEPRNSDYLKAKKSSKWVLPVLELLEKSFGEADGGDIETNFSIIEKTLKDFGIIVERGGMKVGPAVTQYSFRPAVGVKISKILSLQNDLSLALAATIRIEAPIPGQSLVGIEVPNKNSLTVRLRSLLEKFEFKRRKSNLILALGNDVSGNCILEDLSKMPHLLIAGATGTGKSVCINSIITTLLYQNSPDDLRFIMVDPKRVELSLYNGIPHLITTDVVVENSKVLNVLKWAVSEMEDRYKILQKIGARDINSYQEKRKLGYKIKSADPETGEIIEEGLKKMPYIVIVIDELADLMASQGKEVEAAIVRIAQMSRAVGIHLIISTQRPSVEVITGLIKANITPRIAFQVATQIDSRTILDAGGAEKLLGKGDMLFLSPNSMKPKRIQGAFVSEAEVKKVVEFIKSQKKNNEKSEENGESESKKEEDSFGDFQKKITEYKEGEDISGEDKKFIQAAKEEIVRSKKASATFLQRRLRIGYARAARILDILEEEGVIGPSAGAKPREIYISDEKTVNYEDKIDDQAKRDKWQI